MYTISYELQLTICGKKSSFREKKLKENKTDKKTKLKRNLKKKKKQSERKSKEPEEGNNMREH